MPEFMKFLVSDQEVPAELIMPKSTATKAVPHEDDSKHGTVTVPVRDRTDLREIITSITTANPARRDQLLPEPTVFEESQKSTVEPVLTFQGCSVDSEPSDQNQITKIDGINTHVRLNFHVMFVNEQKARWIDVVVLVKLKPEYIWIDYIRGNF
jgi:hypothetical protein